jgi:hypothetical protein
MQVGSPRQARDLDRFLPYEDAAVRARQKFAAREHRQNH